MKQQRTQYCFRQEAGSSIYKLYIYDDVSAYGTFNWNTWEYDESKTSADFFRKELDIIPEDATIELHINSYGGEVKEGIAIYNQLKQKKCKEIIAYVDGFAYSIASVILQAADRRIMGLGTSLLIHNMWMRVEGNANELRKAADDLDVLMESSRQLYMERVNITEEELIEMLDNETYLTPEQAVEKGFADEVDSTRTSAEDITQQLQQQLQQMRREIILQKSFREEMKDFLTIVGQKKEEDTDNEDNGDNDNEDNDSSGDTGNTGNDEEKKQKVNKQNELVALLGKEANKYQKER